MTRPENDRWLGLELVEDRCLRMTGLGGMQLVVPLDLVRECRAEPRADGAIALTLVAGLKDGNGDHELRFSSLFVPRGDRDNLLTWIEDKVRNHVAGTSTGPDRHPADPAPVPGPGPADRGAPPPMTIKGPSLRPEVADDQDWLVLWPLGDTVALSRGELLVPPTAGV